MAGFTKLKSSLIQSTIWDEPSPTRVVWITMLALADAEGFVEASVPGLAHAARVSVAECEEALRCFTSPDPYSKNPANDGRRVAKADRGWLLLNYREHRNTEHRDPDRRREQNREAKRRQRAIDAAQQGQDVSQRQPASASVSQECQQKTAVSQRVSQEAEAEAEAEADKENLLSGKPDVTEQAKAVIDYLNAKAGRDFRHVPANLKFVVARLKSGATVEELKRVVDNRVSAWAGTEQAQYLRPETLFNPTKFESYRQAARPAARPSGLAAGAI